MRYRSATAHADLRLNANPNRRAHGDGDLDPIADANRRSLSYA